MSEDNERLSSEMGSMSLSDGRQQGESGGGPSSSASTSPVPPTPIPANVQARIQAFQISRRNRSNSASAYQQQPNIHDITTPSYSHPGSPSSPANSSTRSPSSSEHLLCNNSNHNNTSSNNSNNNNSSNTSSPVMTPVHEETKSNGGINSPAPFSGALSFTPGASALKAKQPSLSARRGTPNLNTDNLHGKHSQRPVANPGPASAPATSRANRPQMQLPKGGPSAAQTPNALSNYQKYIDVNTGSLNFAGKASLHSKGIDFSSGSSFRVSLDEFEQLGELGRGNYGTVTKVYHRKYDILMAMKEIRLELDETKFRQIIMELEVLHKCTSPFIVDFYGAFFAEGAVYVCMEYMDGGSLDKIYDGGVEEKYLVKITEAVIHGLKQLKDEHNIIHRDVKPTNVLVSTTGKVKLCDFGVSGNLVASMAKTNIGCQSYMAPERIRSTTPANDAMTYTVHSDVWSLGLSILEIAKGCYPYPPETYGNIFSQLSAIVDGDPPSLPEGKFSDEAKDFVDQCLNKVPRLRPSYAKLLAHPWLQKYKDVDVDMGEFVRQALEKKAQNGSQSSARPALHNGRRDQ